ncbi:DUF5677 domain-containing protein [Photobacterium damselae]|uniref:DUF5677 domain-containing protein n=1 Tax=Photobacterium damselae TaxID=38293 RepID=UPI001EE01205|nr:DUF5677 domain-containing protein [Photobacterium damselae]MCG3843730.1 hypothetical protein [Photobacterium damselae]
MSEPQNLKALLKQFDTELSISIELYEKLRRSYNFEDNESLTILSFYACILEYSSSINHLVHIGHFNSIHPIHRLVLECSVDLSNLLDDGNHLHQLLARTNGRAAETRKNNSAYYRSNNINISVKSLKKVRNENLRGIDYNDVRDISKQFKQSKINHLYSSSYDFLSYYSHSGCSILLNRVSNEKKADALTNMPLFKPKPSVVDLDTINEEIGLLKFLQMEFDSKNI